MKPQIQPRGLAVVLGARGFVGRYVSKALAARGYTVIGLGYGEWAVGERESWGLTEWHSGNIDLQTLRQTLRGRDPEAFIFCAGSGSVAYSYINPLDDFRRSVSSLVETLEFLRVDYSSGPRFLLASSAAVYGEHDAGDLTEDAALQPVSPYGVHKVLSENLCRSYSEYFNIDVTVVRFFSVYGRGLVKQLLWDAVKKFRKGEARFFGTGDELRDWIHVDDAASIVCQAIEVAAPGYRIFNAANTQASTREVLTILARELDVKSELEFDGRNHVGNPKRLTASCNHAKTSLGWCPQIGLEAGIRDYASWITQTFSPQP